MEGARNILIRRFCIGKGEASGYELLLQLCAFLLPYDRPNTQIVCVHHSDNVNKRCHYSIEREQGSWSMKNTTPIQHHFPKKQAFLAKKPCIHSKNVL